MSVAIRVEALSKMYQLGQIGTGTISLDMERWFVTRVLRKPDPFLKLAEANHRAVKGDSNFVWSLKDVSFEIEKGETVGIIGKNGAGKSTLLKLLSRVTSPTKGTIKLKGRVASLLEVGTGFHPELSGRENIYLNGSILGMRKKEIDQKLDEIIDFSGVERYIDTPVKRFSSGMYVRLAFAVAAHLESEILIVDEVLAVGDAEFQKKCLGKMEEIGKRDGRTILFVSHNMGAILELCKRGLLLETGQIVRDSDVGTCVASFLERDKHRQPSERSDKNGLLDLGRISINNEYSYQIDNSSPFEVTVHLAAKDIANATLFFIVENAFGQSVVHKRVSSAEIGHSVIDGEFRLHVKIPTLWISPGIYTMYFKTIAPATGWSGRAFSERISVEVAGQAEASGKAFMNPSVTWSMHPEEAKAEALLV